MWGELANDPRSLLFLYESGFPDDAATIDRIADWMGGSLTPEAQERLFKESRRGAIEAVISQLGALPKAQRDARSGDIFDPETQWHAHHAGRSGEIGRWRRALSAEQVQAVEQELGDWMAKFGYTPAPRPNLGYSLSVGSISFKS